MVENQSLIERLQKLLSWKKSKKYYAEKLGITESEVDDLLRELKGEAGQDNMEAMTYIAELEDVITSFDEDLKNQKASLVANVKEQIKSLEELIEKCKIDTNIWEIERYVQNFWGTQDNPHWQVKAWLSKKTEKDNFQKEFLGFLKSYRPTIHNFQGYDSSLPLNKEPVLLIINKQDEHFNKYDIEGKNDISDRFSKIFSKLDIILKQVSLVNYITKVVYVIGSDQFNSEWTQCTTKGTKQENIAPYHESFRMICDHELKMIQLLKSFCKSVDITYVAGNHDEYVGWHLIHWLQAFYRDDTQLYFDTSSRYRKYVQFGNSAIMFNHGDAIKPEKLASMFPIEYREKWSQCENFYIFTGDKHHEVSKDLNGIKFYQLPALSSAKSSWDDKNGHTCSKAELTAFVIEPRYGIVNIVKRPI